MFQFRFPNVLSVWSRGRNGTIKTSGIDVTAWGDCIEMRPITSRGHVSGAAYLGLPATREAVNELHQVMLAAIDWKERLTLIQGAVAAVAATMAKNPDSGAALAAMVVAESAGLDGEALVLLRGQLAASEGRWPQLNAALRDHSTEALSALIDRLGTAVHHASAA